MLQKDVSFIAWFVVPSPQKPRLQYLRTEGEIGSIQAFFLTNNGIFSFTGTLASNQSYKYSIILLNIINSFKIIRE